MHSSVRKKRKKPDREIESDKDIQPHPKPFGDRSAQRDRQRLESPPALRSREARQGQQTNRHTDDNNQEQTRESLETRKAGSAAMAKAYSRVENIAEDLQRMAEPREEHGALAANHAQPASKPV